MRALKISQIFFLFFFLAFLFANCNKNDSTQKSLDPLNLTVEIVSIDQQTGLVVIQASAENAVSYQLFIGDSDSAAAINETGYFEYDFGTAEAQYEITVRAYGESGKYIKVVKTVTISPVPQGPVPLDSGYFSPMSYFF